MSEQPIKDRKITVAERQAKALEFRKAGLGYREIARRLGYKGESGSHKAVQSALKKLLKEPADEVRRLEAERLDTLFVAAYSQAVRGNLGAIDRALKIMERRSRLLGLDAPSRQEVTGKDGGPVETKDTTIDFSKLTDDELQAYISIYRKFTDGGQ